MFYTILGLIVLFLLFQLFQVGYKAVTKTSKELGQVKTNYEIASKALEEKSQLYLELSEKFEKLQHQKKSSEVRTGFISEALLPLTEQFPCDPKSLRFLGAPIDYISFDYDNELITFIETKSGESQLNDHQRKVKKIIEKGNVKFVTVRLNEQGIKVK